MHSAGTGTCSIPGHIPIPLPCNVGTTLKSTRESFLPFGSLLEGYFHKSVTKIFTCHLLSLLRGLMYSSLS